MSDLTHGRYGTFDPTWLLLGRPTNATQADIAARSNLWEQKLSKLENGAVAATEVSNVSAVPVQEGDQFTKVTYLIAETEGLLVTAGYAALYEGKKGGKLLAQSKTKNFGTIEKEKPFTLELESVVQVNSTNAPNGYLYVVLALTSAEAMLTAVCSAVAKATQYEWFTGGPEFLGGTAGTGLKGTAEATLGSVTSKANTPICFLR